MTILLDQNMNAVVYLNNLPTIIKEKTAVAVDGGVTSDGGSMEGDPGMNGENIIGEVKDPLLSSWPAVIGISVATIALGLIIGFLLAKKKIKKGIELYED